MYYNKRTDKNQKSSKKENNNKSQIELYLCKTYYIIDYTYSIYQKNNKSQKIHIINDTKKGKEIKVVHIKKGVLY